MSNFPVQCAGTRFNFSLPFGNSRVSTSAPKGVVGFPNRAYKSRLLSEAPLTSSSTKWRWLGVSESNLGSKIFGSSDPGRFASRLAASSADDHEDDDADDDDADTMAVKMTTTMIVY